MYIIKRLYKLIYVRSYTTRYSFTLNILCVYGFSLSLFTTYGLEIMFFFLSALFV